MNPHKSAVISNFNASQSFNRNRSYKSSSMSSMEKSTEERTKESTLDLRRNTTDVFSPIAVINHMDFSQRVASMPTYPWKLVTNKDRHTNSTKIDDGSTSLTQKNSHEIMSHVHQPKIPTIPMTVEVHLSNSKGIGQESLNEDGQSLEGINTKTSPRKTPSQSHLAIRSDVVNKTLLRSLKRYYTSLFEKEYELEPHSKHESKDEYFSKIKDFTCKIYKDDSKISSPEFRDVTFDDLSFYMGLLINPIQMKKFSLKAPQRAKLQGFYNCLYKYSHKKLQKLFKSKVLCFMFSKFFNEGPLEDMLLNDETLRRNSEVYRKASQTLEESF